jgi:hypothetical protein
MTRIQCGNYMVVEARSAKAIALADGKKRAVLESPRNSKPRLRIGAYG